MMTLAIIIGSCALAWGVGYCVGVHEERKAREHRERVRKLHNAMAELSKPFSWERNDDTARGGGEGAA